jgi:RNA-binding protein
MLTLPLTAHRSVGHSCAMILTGKQKSLLRGLGMLLEPIVHIGKEGVQEAIAPTEDAFRHRELIKVRVLKTTPGTPDEVATELAAATGSAVAGRVGFTFLLYRPNYTLKERIELPEAKEP